MLLPQEMLRQIIYWIYWPKYKKFYWRKRFLDTLNFLFYCVLYIKFLLFLNSIFYCCEMDIERSDRCEAVNERSILVWIGRWAKYPGAKCSPANCPGAKWLLREVTVAKWSLRSGHVAKCPLVFLFNFFKFAQNFMKFIYPNQIR